MDFKHFFIVFSAFLNFHVLSQGIVSLPTISPLDNTLGGTKDTLQQGEKLISLNKRWSLVMEPIGLLVLYDHLNNIMWKSTNGREPNPPYYAKLRIDGYFAMYNDAEDTCWSTSVTGGSSTILILQNDGNLVLYDDNAKAIWTSGTSKFICTAQFYDIRCFSGPATFSGQYAMIKNVQTNTFLRAEANLTVTLVGESDGNSTNWDIRKFIGNEASVMQNIATNLYIRADFTVGKVRLVPEGESIQGNWIGFTITKAIGADGYVFQNVLSKYYLRAAEDGKSLTMVPEDDSVHGDWMRFYVL